MGPEAHAQAEPVRDTCGAPPLRIAIIGSGPTGLYLLAALREMDVALDITIYESARRLGVGTPYGRERNSVSMLANIASIELPPVTMTLLDWVRTGGRDALLQLGIDPAGVHERTFLPRVILGDYFEAQLHELLRRAKEGDKRITAMRDNQVVDLIAGRSACRVVAMTAANAMEEQEYDYVVLATGHASSGFSIAPHRIHNAYQVPRLQDVHSVGILGTSLSAIDVAIGIASEAGAFQENDDEFGFARDSDCPRITMMSRTGLLPEADFYCPIPYEPLSVFTADAASKCTGLDQLFDLMREQLFESDPAYSAAIDLQSATADDFATRFFAERVRIGPIEWARANLAEVERNALSQKTVSWRYAILRMHEPFGMRVADLNECDLERFDKGLRRVFVDNYAAVPPQTVKRLLALCDAGVLGIEALGDDYRLEQAGEGWRVTAGARTMQFDVMVDARGQRPLDRSDISLPTLRLQVSAVQRGKTPGVDVEADYRLGLRGTALGRIYFASLPFLLRRRPFIQGLTSSHEIAGLIAASLRNEAKTGETGLTSDDLEELISSISRSSLIFRAGAVGLLPVEVEN